MRVRERGRARHAAPRVSITPKKCATLAAIKLVLTRETARCDAHVLSLLLLCALLLVPTARAEPVAEPPSPNVAPVPASPAAPVAGASPASLPVPSAPEALPVPASPAAMGAPTSPETSRRAKLGKIEVAPHVSYEQHRLERVLAQQNLVLAEQPEGKRIAFVRIVRDDVFVADEIWPLWWNWFHGRTREDVVRRELLFSEGGHYEDARVEETMRNMRGMGIFTMVRIAAVQGARPDEVGILVMTRDIWSLRIETDVNVTNQVINTLLVRLTELNAFGHNKSVSADVTIQPTNFLVTESFYARRMLGTSFAIKERAGLVFNRLWNTREGEIASLSFGQPYYRLSQRFAWTATFLHDNRVYRNTRNGVIRRYPNPAYNSPPYALQVYRARVDDGYLTASYRGGEKVKQAITVGWDFRDRDAKPTWETDLDDSLRDQFTSAVLPTRRRDNGPTVSYDMFVPSWTTFTNLATYGLSENVRNGPALTLATRLPVRAFGSTANAWVVSATAGWIFTPKGYLIDLKVSGVGRLQQRVWLDQKATFQLRGASPIFSIFRFVMRAYMELRRNDTLRTYVTLGADNGLRGYLSQQIAGIAAHRMLANFELRTVPIMWQAVHLGGVIFYDVGSVFTDFASMHAYHAVGLGLRVFLPQFNRRPFSLDGGMSFDPKAQFVPTVTAGQVVPVTAVEDPET